MKITVLMSAYNGEKYIDKQISSILNQKLPENISLRLIIRDDGSTDKTMDILKKYSDDPAISIESGENLGVARSFWSLIMSCPDSDYYAFSDQDDIWMEGKLRRAITLIERCRSRLKAKGKSSDIPILYAGSYIASSEDMSNQRPQRYKKRNTFTDYAHSLMFSNTLGCTFVFNREAISELRKYDPDIFYVDIHDWLAQKIILIKGRMILDKKPYMYYIQHEDNYYGALPGGMKGFKEITSRFMNGESSGIRSRIAKELIKCYGDVMRQTQLTHTENVAYYAESASNTMKLLKDPSFRTKSSADIFMVILAILRRI